MAGDTNVSLALLRSILIGLCRGVFSVVTVAAGFTQEKYSNQHFESCETGGGRGRGRGGRWD